MSVHWKPLPEGMVIKETDTQDRVYTHTTTNNLVKRERCTCGYKIRGKRDDHESGPHHQRPKKK